MAISLTTRRRAIHAIIDVLTRDYIARGGVVKQASVAYAAPVQQVHKHRVIKQEEKPKPLHETFEL